MSTLLEDLLEINLINEDLLDINAALGELVPQEYYGSFMLPDTSYENLGGFDTVSLGFEVPLEKLMVNLEPLILSIDDLMDPGQAWLDLNAQHQEYSQLILEERDLEFFDNVSLLAAEGFRLTNLSEVTSPRIDVLSNYNLLDPTLAYLEMSGEEEYHPSPLFSVIINDIDSYDTVSIQVEQVSSMEHGSNSSHKSDWKDIFADIERCAADHIFGHGIMEPGASSEMEATFSRSAISLVKGTGTSKSKQRMFKHLENQTGDSFDILGFNESRDVYIPGNEVNIPLRLYMEDGELVLRVNLPPMGLREMGNVRFFPGGMNMRSMLSHIPRQINTNNFQASINGGEFKLVIPC